MERGGEMTLRAKMQKRMINLQSERNYFFDYWGELSDFFHAARGRHLMKNKSKQPKRNTKQYNNTPRIAVRTLASGMMSGITSPARQWFKLSLSDKDLAESRAVREWLFNVQMKLYQVYSQSNIYNMLHSVYAELGVFGTADIGVYEDPKRIIRAKTFTAGSYMLAAGADGVIDTHYYEYQKSVSELVKTFGYDSCSDTVKKAWDKGNIETMIDCVHVIEPNDNRNEISPLASDMAFRSLYFEDGAKGDDPEFLHRSGFPEFPHMTPRWDVIGEEVYAHECPAMMAIGDSKGLQLGERRFYQALDKVGNPPLQGPSDMKNHLKGGVPSPGSMSWHTPGSSGISSVYGNYAPRIDFIRSAQEVAEARINEAFYKDLFLMLASDNRNREITAREVAERHEEKLIMLGPVLERLHAELLDPLIDRTFNIMQRNGMLPAPPQELADQELSVEYVSILAQAQKAVGLGAIERTVGFAMEMSQVWPGAKHKINAQQTIDDYARNAGVDPQIIRSDDEAEQMSQAENQMMQQQATLASEGQAIDNMSKLAEVQQASDQQAIERAV